MTDERSIGIYLRWSTQEQTEQHQRQDINEWLADHDLTLGDVDVYAEQASGTATERNEFQTLVDAIEAGDHTDVVVWEISRIARKGFLARQFFDTCEDNSVTIHVTNGSVRKVDPDGHGRMVADVIAAVAAEERRALIRRTQAGLRQARQEGKWMGQIPTGFVRVDGYLRPNFSPDYEAGETGYHDIADALEAIENGKSYRAAGRETPNVTRQTLMRIDDSDRRSWYLNGESEDGRVAEALDEVR